MNLSRPATMENRVCREPARKESIVGPPPLQVIHDPIPSALRLQPKRPRGQSPAGAVEAVVHR